MATRPAPKRWSYAEFARLPDDGNRYEIIAGELYVSPSANYRHQLARVRITGIFENFTREHGIGQIYGPVDVLLSGTDYLAPDLIFLKHERRGIRSNRGFEGHPISPSRLSPPPTRSGTAASRGSGTRSLVSRSIG